MYFIPLVALPYRRDDFTQKVRNFCVVSTPNYFRFENDERKKDFCSSKVTVFHIDHSFAVSSIFDRDILNQWI